MFRVPIIVANCTLDSLNLSRVLVLITCKLHTQFFKLALSSYHNLGTCKLYTRHHKLCITTPSWSSSLPRTILSPCPAASCTPHYGCSTMHHARSTYPVVLPTQCRTHTATPELAAPATMYAALALPGCSCSNALACVCMPRGARPPTVV